jgi:hypothetical protein
MTELLRDRKVWIGLVVVGAIFMLLYLVRTPSVPAAQPQTPREPREEPSKPKDAQSTDTLTASHMNAIQNAISDMQAEVREMKKIVAGTRKELRKQGWRSTIQSEVDFWERWYCFAFLYLSKGGCMF